ncbi:hypothetical protein KBB27_01150, partial [Patescibacteria group bacterium]|nr:hypothetical protein [Patescibacteria group bacterium]
FIHDRFLPDKAFDIIDEACAKVAIESAEPHHATALGILHDASQYTAECGGSSPVVTEQDVEEIGRQWEKHRTRPAEKNLV